MPGAPSRASGQRQRIFGVRSAHPVTAPGDGQFATRQQQKRRRIRRQAVLRRECERGVLAAISRASPSIASPRISTVHLGAGKLGGGLERLAGAA